MWERNTEVRLILNPGRVGICTGNKRQRGDRLYIQIKFTDGSTDYVSENEIELEVVRDLKDPYELIKQGLYGRSSDLRRNLTFVHLAGRLANLVYSMGITNTDFWAHQYKPLLTLLESPANGILIADEVGLGKTIEAGLIWTELRARYDMRRLLVICPAMLREKWRDELMNRFGINAKIVGAKDLLEDLKMPISSTADGEAWVTSYQSIRPPKDWKHNKDNISKPNARRKLCDFLEENAESEKLLDMVVFDEAHYMRNEDSAVHTLGTLIRDVSDYLVLLSATPINLKNNDLFNLLKLTDPEHFRNIYDFEDMIEANKPLIRARDLALHKDSNSEDIIEALNDAKTKTLLSTSSQLKALLAKPPTDEKLKEKTYRAELADSLERMNLLGHVVTRTRKRDINTNRPQRIVHRESVPMTEVEKDFYTAVTELTRNYAVRKNIVEGFLLATFQRQVSSCPAATLKNWQSKDYSWIEDIVNESDQEDGDIQDESMSLRDYIFINLPKTITVDALEKNDSKFERVHKVIKEYLNENPEHKVILFTTFRATAKYLEQRFLKVNVDSMLLWGNMNAPKQEFIDEFRESNKLKILISTEVAAEGVDLQFSNFLVNYDLPWNPMRVEQRIGRIDRLGQKADKLHIWNLYFKNSIDDRIVTRLMNRLKIFEEALGEPEPVVGEAISRLESELLTRPLTEEEEDQRIEQTAQALENLRQVQLHLQENASQIISHGGLLLEKIEAAQDFSKRVTEMDLIVYVKDYLINHAQGHTLEEHINMLNTFDIKLPPKMAADLDEYLRRSQLLGQTGLSTGNIRKCQFLNKVNYQGNRTFEVINQFHPLIRFISAKLKELDEHYYPVLAIHLKDKPSFIEKGDYVFCVKKTSFEGVKSEELLNVLVGKIGTDMVLNEDLSDKLVSYARLNGKDWLDAHIELRHTEIENILDKLEQKLDDRFEQQVDRKKNENEDRVNFQITSVDQYLIRKLPDLEALVKRFTDAGNLKIARLNQGKINKLKEKYAMQMEKIRLRDKLGATKNFVCAGVIRVS